MNRKLISLSVGVFCLSTFADVSIWKGGETVEWSAAGSWEGGVPAEGGSALFVTTDSCNTYKVTPPDGFKGTILVSNDQQVTTSYNTRYFCFNTVLDLTISENAAWKVAGSGVVVANAGLADRLADDFMGTVSIPVGKSFVASSTLNSSVEFIGCGTLTVSSVARLDHVAGFSGTILREGDAAGAGFDNMLQFHGRTFAPKDGETLTISQDMVSFDAIKRIVAPGQNGWVFNTLNPHLEAWGRYDESNEAPYVDANGTFVPGDTPGQATTAFFTNHVFQLCDDWSVSFKYVTRCPFPSQVSKRSVGSGQQGYLGFFFSPIAPEGNVLDQVVPMSAGYGFEDRRESSDSAYSLHWRYASNNNPNYQIKEQNVPACQVGGSKTNDMTVSCVKGVLYVTYQNGAESFTTHKSFANLIKQYGTGYHIGFGFKSGGSATGYQNWMMAEVFDFSGWYRSREEGPWADVSNASAFELNTDNWTNEVKMVENGVVVAKKMADAYGADGKMMLQKGTGEWTSSLLRYSHGFAIGKNTVSRNGRYRMTFDFDWSTRSGGGYYGCLYLGFCVGRDAEFCASGGARYGLGRDGWGDVECWLYGVHLEARLASSEVTRLRCCAGDKLSRTADGSGTTTSRNLNVPAVANSKVTYSMYYDDYTGQTGCDFYSRPADGTAGGSSGSLNFRVHDTHMEFLHGQYIGNSIRPAVWSGSDNSVIGTDFSGFSLQELSDNVNPYLDSCVKVTGGRHVTLKVEPTHPSSTTPVATMRKLALGANAELTLSTDASAKLAVDSIEAACGSSIGAGDGATLAVGDCLAFTGTATESGLAFSGKVAFPSGIRIALPSSWITGRKKIRIIDVSAAEVLGGLPTTVTVVDENGMLITKAAHVTLDDDGVLINDLPGMMLMLR